MNSNERKPVAYVFIYLILSTHPIQLSAIHHAMKAQMKFKESLQAGGGAGVFDQESIAFIENEFEELFQGLHELKEHIEDMNAKYESSPDANNMSFKGAPWHMPNCGHDIDYKVKTLKQKEAELGLLQLNETAANACSAQKKQDSCEDTSGCKWRPGRMWGGECMEAVSCGTCSVCSVKMAASEGFVTFYKDACTKEGTLCEWEGKGEKRGVCKPKKCEALKSQGKQLMPQVEKMTSSMKNDFNKEKPSASENSKKSSMGKGELKKNVGHAKLFKDVQRLSQNAEDAHCKWYTDPEEGDPNFKAILDLMDEKDMAKRIMAEKDDREAVFRDLAPGVDKNALKIHKPGSDEYAKVEGQTEGEESQALKDVEDRFDSNSNSKEGSKNQQRSRRSSSSSNKPKTKAKTAKRRSWFGGFGSSSSKKSKKTAPQTKKWLPFGLVQTKKNTSSEVLHTGELVSSDTQVVTKDGFAFCLIPFLGWGFCSMVAFMVVMYLFVVFVACFYAMMVFILPLYGMMFCGMLAFVGLLWRLFKSALIGEWQPDRVGILDKCMPYFTWPLANTGNEKWLALLTCAFGSMR